ncbi:MAG: AtpZ/AtpI family protein [Alphaproteobacteria bacterium]|nr:AtpZ/AtpI family protein [Alphaproteobacteria bacterium]
MKEVDHENGGDHALQERLAKLGGAIEKKRAGSFEEDRRLAEAASVVGETGKAMALGFRALSELIAGVAVGGFIGWQIDRWSGLSPIFLLVFLMLGFAAGFWNVVKLGSGKSSTRSMYSNMNGRSG